MAIPGTYTLAALTITTAITAQRQTAIIDLEGMSRAVIEAEFSGTGGSSGHGRGVGGRVRHAVRQ